MSAVHQDEAEDEYRIDKARMRASFSRAADSYDAAGKLIRVDTMPTIPNYVFGYGMIPDQTVTLDLERGAYMVPSFTAFKGGGYGEVKEQPGSTFSSEDMAQSGIR